MPPTRDPRVDAYLARSAPFAQPILAHLRALVHRACPNVVETIKWSNPFFEHHGTLCFMSEFKQHCGFGFWHREMAAKISPQPSDKAMGNFGRITTLADLPPDRTLLRYLKTAITLNETRVPAPGRTKSATSRPEAEVPPALTAALARNRAAAAAFAAFSPSHRREYCEWISEAKRDETRDERVATALAWLSEGKSRNWKYERG